MQIDWWTLALQAVNFLVLVWLLWRFLYRPVREVIERRKQLADKAFADAEQQKSNAEAARQRFEDDRDRLAQERQELLKKIHEELESERREVLDEARHQSEERLEAARKSIAREREAALTEIREQVSALAVDLASDLLRNVESGASCGAALEALERQLKEMPAEERERLRKDLAADNAHLTVVTSSPLAPETQQQWIDRLNDCLGPTGRADFATDPEILGGAELRFPHAVLKFTWADQLQRAKERLQDNEPA